MQNTVEPLAEALLSSYCRRKDESKVKYDIIRYDIILLQTLAGKDKR